MVSDTTPHSKAEAGSTDHGMLPVHSQPRLTVHLLICCNNLEMRLLHLPLCHRSAALRTGFDHRIDHAEDNTTSSPARAPYRLSWAESAQLQRLYSNPR